MNPQEVDYQKLFTELIKKQILILGPDITLSKIKNVKGISVDSSGNVLNLEGDPKVLLQEVIDQFIELSGMIVKKTMESVFSEYPIMQQEKVSPVSIPVSSNLVTQIGNEHNVDNSKAISLDQIQVSGLNENTQPQISSLPNQPEPPSTTEVANYKPIQNSPTPQVQKNDDKNFSPQEIEDLNKALDDLKKTASPTQDSQKSTIVN